MSKTDRYVLIAAIALLMGQDAPASDTRSAPSRPTTIKVRAASPSHPDVLQTQDLGSGLTLEDIIAALVGSSSISISNVRFTGSDSSLGTFTGGTGIIGFEQGIVLSSGQVADVVGPNVDDGMTSSYNRAGDPDLDSLISGIETTQDACVLEFDFACPDVREIGFEYVFSSDEYNEFVNFSFNDVFGFFVNGENVALLPDGQTIVSINNVNGGNPLGDSASNAQYYRNNDECQGSPNGCPFNTEMDGLTVVLIARAQINPGLNHIKLAVADAGDDAWDSNVFLKGQSFICGAVNNNAPTCAINPSGPFSLNAGTNLTFSVTGTDPDDGQTIYLYSLGSLPPGATMIPSLPRAGSRTGLSSQFSWTPSQPGIFTASFYVTDSLGGADTATVQVTVTSPHVNMSPTCEISPPGPFTVNAGTNVSFGVSAADPDVGQIIRLSTFGTPLPGATMNPPLPIFGPWTGVSSQFSWTPTQLGSFLARFSASDSAGGFDSISARINVLEGVPPHVVITTPQAGATEVEWQTIVRIRFSERINSNQIPASFLASSARNVTMSISSEPLNDSIVAISTQQQFWPDDDVITIRVLGSLTDPAGNTLDGNGDGISEGTPGDDHVFSFSTAPGVYPGDANDDGIVDERDVLSLGVHFLRTGPDRKRNGDVWSLEAATAWSPREATHADCDGNGVVDSTDVCTILEFFDREIPAKRAPSIYDFHALSLLDESVRASLARALLDCNQGSSAARAALLEALTGQASAESLLPKSFELTQNYPNPFNAGTVISWEMDSPSHVELTIFDVLGRRVRMLIEADSPAGFHSVNWDGENDAGAAMASGVYIYRISTDTHSATKRMVLIR